MPPRRRVPILSPAYWHPAAARRGNRLFNGPESWRPASIPVGAYARKLSGIPLTGGQGTAIISSAGSPGLGAAPIQSASNSATTGTTVTVTLPNPTGAGHCLVIYAGAVNSTTNPTVSGITLGGSADHFASAKSLNNNADTNCEIWTDQNCAGGQTSVVVTFGGGSGAALAMAVLVDEWPAVLTSGAVDQTAGAVGSSTSWSSGSTPALAQITELAAGAVFALAGQAGPSSPWVNHAQVTAGASYALLSGYQVVSSTAGLAYAGTGPNTVFSAVIATLKALPASSSVAGLASITVGPQGLGNVWYPAQVAVSTTSGVNDTSTCQVFLGPVGTPITLLGTIFPGGIGTLGAAVPPLAPGQYLIAQWTGGNPGDVAAINVVGTMDSVMPG